jgi:RNA polymerase sigma-70 factor (ECF subfamily)
MYMPPVSFRSERSTAEAQFDALVRPHYDALYRTAWRWTRSREEAEDLVQDTIVRAYPRLSELERLDRPGSWLKRVMYRLFIDSIRRHDRSKVVPLEAVGPDGLACERPGPEESAERARNAERVAQVWKRIDREKRALLALHDIEGYTLAEIMEITGLKEGTLKSRLHRSRVLLGRLLDPDCVVTELRAGAGGGKS